MPDGYVPNRELIELIQRVCKQFMNSFQPRPKRGRRPRRGGGGAPSTIAAGIVAVATQSIAGTVESTWANMSAANKAAIDPQGTIPGTAKTFKLASGGVNLYQIFIEMGGQFGQSIVAVYAVPVPGSTAAVAYNTTREAVSIGKLLQCKSIKSSTDEDVLLVDVEPCG